MGRVEVTAAITGEVCLVVEQPQHQAAIGGEAQGLHARKVIHHGRTEIRLEPVDLITADIGVALMQRFPPDPCRLPVPRQAGTQRLHLGGG
ncbi:hypothetical protein D3C78_1224180 [compost metagenome]